MTWGPPIMDDLQAEYETLKDLRHRCEEAIAESRYYNVREDHARQAARYTARMQEIVEEIRARDEARRLADEREAERRAAWNEAVREARKSADPEHYLRLWKRQHGHGPV